MQERKTYTVKICNTLIVRDTPTTRHVFVTHRQSTHDKLECCDTLVEDLWHKSKVNKIHLKTVQKSDKDKKEQLKVSQTEGHFARDRINVSQHCTNKSNPMTQQFSTCGPRPSVWWSASKA